MKHKQSPVFFKMMFKKGFREINIEIRQSRQSVKPFSTNWPFSVLMCFYRFLPSLTVAFNFVFHASVMQHYKHNQMAYNCLNVLGSLQCCMGIGKLCQCHTKDVPRGADGVRPPPLGGCGAPAGRRLAEWWLAGVQFLWDLRTGFRAQQNTTIPSRGPPWSELGPKIKSK